MKHITLTCILASLLVSCVSAQKTTEELRWFDGELKAAKTPVVFVVKNLKPGTAYNIQVYDRYHQSENMESASTKTTLMRPDGSTPKSYQGTHDGVHYSDDPGGIVFTALDKSVTVRVETGKESGVGVFRFSIAPVTASTAQAAEKTELVLEGIPVIRKGTPGESPVTAGYGIFLHGSSVVPEARDLMGTYAKGGDYVFASAETGRFVDIPFVRSAESLILDTKARANASYAEHRALLASAFLFDGGDQSVYYEAWKDSAFARGVNAALAKRQASIGGNSAGLAILGEIVFAALESGSLVSEEALVNPYSLEITLRKGPFAVPELKGAVTDSHFSERDRQGRLVVFLARMLTDKMTVLGETIGVGVDENTCLVIDNDGRTRVYGEGSAWIFVPQSAPDICRPGAPLTWKGDAVKVIVLGKGSPALPWSEIRKQPAAFHYEVLEGKLIKR